MKVSFIRKACLTLVVWLVVGSSHAEAGLWSSLLRGVGLKAATEVAAKPAIGILKAGAPRVVKVMSKRELATLIGHEPVHRMSSLINMRNLNEAVDLAAHNPSKEKVWKALADCADIENEGGSVRCFMRSSVEAPDAFTSVNGKGLESMYRYARMYKLTTEANLSRMRQGLAPNFPDGSVAHLDHIVPVKYAPELKTLPANLRILSSAENTSRKAAIDNSCRRKVSELRKSIPWTPNQELARELERAR